MCNSSFKIYFFSVFGVSLVILSSYGINSIDTYKCDDNDNCIENNNSHFYKYSKEANSDSFWKEYLDMVSSSFVNYKNCSSEKCSCHNRLISSDLKSFQNSISKASIEDSRLRGTHYQIINHHLYRDKECMFPSRCSGAEHFLLKVIKKIPDTEFILNTRDYPQVPKYYGTKLPIFSFSKTADYIDITYPAWTFWEGGPAISIYPTGLGQWEEHRSSLMKEAELWPWQTKKEIAFFRGSRTSSERDALIYLSRQNPEMVDALYTKNQAWKSDADTLYASPATEVTLESHCQYKYLFNYRGVAASFRFKHLFLCKSLVFHVGDEWIEFFYHKMEPWVHYIPVTSDASEQEIQKLITFAKENDDVARKIAEMGYEFIKNHLRIKDVLCYWKKLLLSYTKLLSYKPERKKDLIEIKNK